MASDCEAQGASAADQDSLGPQLAGARARGVADALALLGLPAILLDREGRTLHVSREAALMAGSAFAIDRRRPTAANRDSDIALQTAIYRALDGRAGPAARILAGDSVNTADSVILVHALPIPGGSDDAFQLLGCVLVMERQGADVNFALSRAAMGKIAASAAGIYATH